ncbi:MAG: hypothetical protein Q7U98_02680 [Methylicorpusculum sp.]|uniref:hypothetical protein n=1 Tax=Methylicorpusculum sp. TaxID=2713644 RepID=UPI0027220B4D|nr:hypothetical protein [Methylicorpusculum sp.]MDO8938045.1 hypothetical protein [Methylicorpusculum sp.]MDP2201025.1 hypothetical protein [Methylicorpusculum sp.]
MQKIVGQNKPIGVSGAWLAGNLKHLPETLSLIPAYGVVAMQRCFVLRPVTRFQSIAISQPEFDISGLACIDAKNRRPE